MKKLLLTTIIVIALLVATLIWWYGDTQLIKRQTNTLVSSLTVENSETKSSRLAKTQRFRNLLDSTVGCRVNITDHQTYLSHDELVSTHHVVVNNLDSSSVTASNVTITITNKTEARSTAEVSLSLTPKNGASYFDACTLVLDWKKNTSGKWLVTSIDISTNNDP